MKVKIEPRQRSDETKSIRLASHGWYLRMLGTWMDEKMNEKLEPLGLTLSHFTIIMTLLEKEGLSQVELGQRAMLPPYATTRNIDRLESLGYVKRRRHETSRRSYRILLTDAGRALAPHLFTMTNSINEHFLAATEEEEKAELLRILIMVTRKLGLHDEE